MNGHWTSSPFSAGATYSTSPKPPASSGGSSGGSGGSSGGGTTKKVELKNVWLGGNGVPAQVIPGATQAEVDQNAKNIKVPSGGGINPANLQPTASGLAHIKEAEATKAAQPNVPIDMPGMTEAEELLTRDEISDIYKKNIGRIATKDEIDWHIDRKTPRERLEEWSSTSPEAIREKERIKVEGETTEKQSGFFGALQKELRDLYSELSESEKAMAEEVFASDWEEMSPEEQEALQYALFIPSEPEPYPEFEFGEEGVRAEKEEEYGKYYDEILNDFLTTQGIEKSRLGEDVTTAKEELTTEKEKYLGEEDRQYNIALRGANEGYAEAGIIFSGIRQRGLGEMGEQRSYGIEKYNRTFQQAMANIQQGETRTLENIAREKELKEREIGRAETTAVEGAVATEKGRGLEEWGIKKKQYEETAPRTTSIFGVPYEQMTELYKTYEMPDYWKYRRQTP